MWELTSEIITILCNSPYGVAFGALSGYFIGNRLRVCENKRKEYNQAAQRLTEKFFREAAKTKNNTVPDLNTLEFYINDFSRHIPWYLFRRKTKLKQTWDMYKKAINKGTHPVIEGVNYFNSETLKHIVTKLFDIAKPR